MLKKLYIVIAIFIVSVIVDQYIKSIFVDGFVWHSDCISLILAYNKGVAFSMFAFLASYLKYIQILLVAGIIIYLLNNKEIFMQYYIPVALFLSGAISNIYDRFIHIGVVDYVYWHCKFDFAIFNLADVLIDLSIVMVLYISYKESKKDKI